MSCEVEEHAQQLASKLWIRKTILARVAPEKWIISLEKLVFLGDSR